MCTLADFRLSFGCNDVELCGCGDSDGDNDCDQLTQLYLYIFDQELWE